MVLVLPSAQIRLGAKTLQGLVGTYYTVAYTGGKCTMTNDGQATDHAYTLGGDGWYGWTGQSVVWGTKPDGHGGTVATTSSNDCQDDITATFTWVSTGPGDDPPKSVIIEEEGRASWGGSGPSAPSGSCSDGLGDSEVPDTGNPSPTYKGGSSGGTRYSVKQDPGASFTLTAPAGAHVSGTGAVTQGVTGATTQGSGAASVKYRASVSPVTISLAGATKDATGTENILIGQLCTAGLNVPDFNPSQITVTSWSISGQTFRSYDVTESGTPPTASTASVNYDLGPLGLQRSFCWNDLAALQTVSCTATVQSPSGPLTVTGEKKVKLWEPTYSASVQTGDVLCDKVHLYMSPFQYGCQWTGQVQTPALFGTGGGWNWVQKIHLGRWRTPNNGTEQGAAGNGTDTLDATYPYEPPNSAGAYSATDPGQYPADNSQHVNGDSTSIPLDDDYQAYRADESFNTYLMYLPPGTGSQWVPLASTQWDWYGAATRPGATWFNWPAPSSVGNVYATGFIRSLTHPTWQAIRDPHW